MGHVIGLMSWKKKVNVCTYALMTPWFPSEIHALVLALPSNFIKKKHSQISPASFPYEAGTSNTYSYTSSKVEARRDGRWMPFKKPFQDGKSLQSLIDQVFQGTSKLEATPGQKGCVQTNVGWIRLRQIGGQVT